MYCLTQPLLYHHLPHPHPGQACRTEAAVTPCCSGGELGLPRSCTKGQDGSEHPQPAPVETGTHQAQRWPSAPWPQRSLTKPLAAASFPARVPLPLVSLAFPAVLPEGSGLASVLCHQVPSSRGAEVRPPPSPACTVSLGPLTRGPGLTVAARERRSSPGDTSGLAMVGPGVKLPAEPLSPTGFFPSHLSQQQEDPPPHHVCILKAIPLSCSPMPGII